LASVEKRDNKYQISRGASIKIIVNSQIAFLI